MLKVYILTISGILSGMKKRLPLIIAAILFLLTAGVLVYIWQNQSDDQPNNSANVESEQPAEPPESSESLSVATGDPVLLPEWKVQFALPEGIDTTEEIRMILPTIEGQETVIIGSTALQDKLDKETCSGPEFEMGAFMQIVRYDDPAEDRIQVGDHHYLISDAQLYKDCYAADTHEKYFSEDVYKAASETLKASN